MKAAIEATVNPARQGSVAQPQAADVEKLRQHCAVMTAAAAELQQVLSQDTRRDAARRGMGGCRYTQSHKSRERRHQLRSLCQMLACFFAKDRKLATGVQPGYMNGTLLRRPATVPVLSRGMTSGQ